MIKNEKIKEYVEVVLRRAHPARIGETCPFIKIALQKNGIVYTEIKQYEFDDIELFKAKLEFIDWKIMTQIFIPEDDIELKILKKFARKIRNELALQGLMIGAFGPEDNTPSIYSDDLYLFRSPSNILVVRQLVRKDLDFIDNAPFYTKLAIMNGFINKNRNEILLNMKMTSYLNRPHIKFLCYCKKIMNMLQFI